MAGTIVVDRIESDSSYTSTINVASKVNFTGGMQVGGQDTTFGGIRNRVINGDMRIDQRNAGASVSLTAPVYTLDRWNCYVTQSGKATTQQNQGSVTPPSGFTNYLGYTSSSAYSVVSGDIFTIRHIIEGNNIADLDWGKATAKTVTLSFWVRSSLTGTFTGALTNNAQSRTYGFSYTINSTNTWEYKTITIPGDTTGTWATDNTRGIDMFFSLGMGSTYTTPSNGSWLAGTYYAGTGGRSLVGTSGATFQITGVQLEKGSTASSFEYRMYGQEFALCQRYFQISAIGASKEIAFGAYWGTSEFDCFATFQTSMRTVPTIYQVSGTDYFGIEKSGGDDTFNAWTGLARGTTFGCLLYTNGGVSGTGGFGAVVQTLNALSVLGFQAEL